MIWRLVAVVIATFGLALQSCKQRELAFFGSCHGNLRSPLLGIRGCKPIICLGLVNLPVFFCGFLMVFLGIQRWWFTTFIKQELIHDGCWSPAHFPSFRREFGMLIGSQSFFFFSIVECLSIMMLYPRYAKSTMRNNVSGCWDSQNVGSHNSCNTLARECRNLHHL